MTLKGLASLGIAVQGAGGRGAVQPLTELATLPSEFQVSGYSDVSMCLLHCL